MVIIRYNCYTKKVFIKIINTPRFLPDQGDLVIFGDGEHGHVAIVLYANVNYMIVLEQDGYKQDGAKPAMHNYKNVLGFLRYKA